MKKSGIVTFVLVVVLFLVGIVCLAAWLNGYAITWKLLFAPLLGGLFCAGLYWRFGEQYFSKQFNRNDSTPKIKGVNPEEKQMEQAEETARKTTRTHSVFLNNIGHELRTPLSIILGYAEIIEQDSMEADNASISKLAQKIKLYTKQLSALVNDLLRMSEIESGEVKFLLEAFTIDNVIEQVVKQVQTALETNNNQLLLMVPPEAGMMMADRDKVRVILVNLLNNAAKFTHNGIVTLTVSRQITDGREWIYFAVTDTGIGIEPALQEAIFSPFQQADGSFTREHSGMGLGLAINRYYCQLMGGRIEVTSQPGEGATFTVCLPAEVTAVASMYVNAPTLQKTPGERISS